MAFDPEVFGGFYLAQRIAESAMADVFVAVRLLDASGRSVVLKRPPVGERSTGRAATSLRREAEVLAEVKGPGLVRLEGAGEIAGLPYVAIEHLRGAPLAALLDDGPLPAGALAAVATDLAGALTTLHQKGWVHRDVNPTNIFVDDGGDTYLIDFGLAARSGTAARELAGTRGYVAPEVPALGAISPAQDVYAMAVVLAEAGLGRRLFDEPSLASAAGRGDPPGDIATVAEILPRLAEALLRDPAARPGADALLPKIQADRAALATCVDRVRQGSADTIASAPGLAVARPGQAALTPTAPMAAVTAMPGPAPIAPSSTWSSAPAPQPLANAAIRTRDVTPNAAPHAAHASTGAIARSPSRPLLGAWAWIAIVAIVATGTFFAGRFSTRGRSTIMFTGALPKRAELELDGKRVSMVEDTPMPVPFGSHTFVLSTPKGPKRSFPFTARPGEHLVVVIAARGNAEDDRDRPEPP